MSSLKIVNIEKRFPNGSYGVKNFDLTVNNGEFLSFLGPSGCGKSTTLRIIAGLEAHSNGEIFFDEELVSSSVKNFFVPPEQRKIGMVFQSYAVWPHMNVFGNVAYPLKLKRLSKSEIENRVTETLKLVELDGLEERRPHELSGGQQQRVALARGLVMRPRILLLDEPFSNLDTKLREKMRRDVVSIQKQFGLTMIYVTHDLSEAFEMSDRVVVMNKGSIEQIGTPSEIQNNPSSDFVSDFLGI